MGERAAQWVAIGLLAAVLSIGFVWLADIQTHQNDALHSIICTIEFKELHPARGPAPSVVRQRQIVEFWSSELAGANLKPCE